MKITNTGSLWNEAHVIAALEADYPLADAETTETTARTTWDEAYREYQEARARFASLSRPDGEAALVIGTSSPDLTTAQRSAAFTLARGASVTSVEVWAEDNGTMGLSLVDDGATSVAYFDSLGCIVGDWA